MPSSAWKRQWTWCAGWTEGSGVAATMRPMNFQKVFVPLTGLLLLGLSYRSFGWSGVAVACTGIVMFLLLHFTRTMQVLKRAAERPIGYVASAVMLNAKLKPGVTLLHVWP